MHVICPRCGARYAVDPMAIGPTGRTVECVRCHHRWFEKTRLALPETVQPPARSAAMADVPACSPQVAKLPGRRSTLPGPRWGTWLSVVLGLILLTGISAFAYRKEIREQLPAEWQTILTWQTLRTLTSPPDESP